MQAEGKTEVVIELVEGTNRSSALIDLKDRIEQINSFPDGVDEIIASEVKRKDRVITIVISGNAKMYGLLKSSER